MARFDVDFFVIGGGSGGVRAARVAAEHGARVAIAERDRWGGTCVIRGCVPKKLLVFASEVRRTLDDAAGQGWTIASASHDWATRPTHCASPALHTRGSAMSGGAPSSLISGASAASPRSGAATAATGRWPLRQQVRSASLHQ